MFGYVRLKYELQYELPVVCNTRRDWLKYQAIVDTLKRQILRQHFNRSKQCLNLSTFQKTSRRQADDQVFPILKGQSNDLNLTDPVKQTVSWVLPLKRPKQAYEAKSVQHLASHEPMGRALLEALQPWLKAKILASPEAFL